MVFFYLSALGSYLLLCLAAAIFYHRNGHANAAWIFVLGMLLTPAVAIFYVFLKGRKQPDETAATFDTNPQQLHAKANPNWPTRSASAQHASNEDYLERLQKNKGLEP